MRVVLGDSSVFFLAAETNSTRAQDRKGSLREIRGRLDGRRSENLRRVMASTFLSTQFPSPQLACRRQMPSYRSHSLVLVLVFVLVLVLILVPVLLLGEQPAGQRWRTSDKRGPICFSSFLVMLASMGHYKSLSLPRPRETDDGEQRLSPRAGHEQIGTELLVCFKPLIIGPIDLSNYLSRFIEFEICGRQYSPKNKPLELNRQTQDAASNLYRH